MPTSCARAPSKALTRWASNDFTWTERYQPVRMICASPSASFWSVLLSCIFSAARVTRVKADDLKPPAAQFVDEPGRHRPGLDLDAGLIAGMAAKRLLDHLGRRGAYAAPDPAAACIDNTDRRCLLRHVQANKVGHRSASDGRNHRATAPGSRHYRPISPHRDYMMSTQDHQHWIIWRTAPTCAVRALQGCSQRSPE